MRTLLGLGLVLGLACGVAAADEKIDAAKLIGKWEPKEPKKDQKMQIEFAKEGKLTLTIGGDGKEIKLDGTYSVEGNKINVAVKFGDKEQKMVRTVTKLTETELTSKDEKGKEDTLVRVKAK